MPAEQVIQCSAACTVTVQHELSIAGLNIDIPTAFQLGGGIALCWCIAYFFKAIGDAIKHDPSKESEI